MNDLRELNRQKVIERWRRFHSKETNYLEKNKVDSLRFKARLHGYLCGDGSVSKRVERGTNKTHYDIRFYPDHESLIKPFTEALIKVYGKTATVRKDINYYRVFLTSKTVALDLLRDKDFSSTGWVIPIWIEQNKRCLREWLSAYFDAEAYVGPKEIRIQTVSYVGARAVRRCLKKFDIVTHLYSYKRKKKSWNTNFHVAITNKENRERFFKKIGFNHKSKYKKLEQSLAEVA